MHNIVVRARIVKSDIVPQKRQRPYTSVHKTQMYSSKLSLQTTCILLYFLVQMSPKIYLNFDFQNFP